MHCSVNSKALVALWISGFPLKTSLPKSAHLLNQPPPLDHTSLAPLWASIFKAEPDALLMLQTQSWMWRGFRTCLGWCWESLAKVETEHKADNDNFLGSELLATLAQDMGSSQGLIPSAFGCGGAWRKQLTKQPWLACCLSQLTRKGIRCLAYGDSFQRA